MNDIAPSGPVIVMSCFNGSNFLKEQIESIRCQTVTDWRLIVRDDGSSDATCNMLKNFSVADSRIKIVYGTNVGVIASFLDLVKRVDPAASMVVFADQDDVWHTTKLQVQADLLAPHAEKPALTYSALRLVDRVGSALPQQYLAVRAPTFKQLLVENYVPGCTISINNYALRLIAENMPSSSRILMHDWWIMLTVSAFGQIFPSSQRLIDYRQHGDNVVGIKTGFAGLIHRVRRLIKGRGGARLLDQAEEFVRIFGEHLVPTQRKAIDSLLTAGRGTLRQRAVSAFDRSFHRSTAKDDIAMRFLLLSGHYRSRADAQ